MRRTAPAATKESEPPELRSELEERLNRYRFQSLFTSSSCMLFCLKLKDIFYLACGMRPTMYVALLNDTGYRIQDQWIRIPDCISDRQWLMNQELFAQYCTQITKCLWSSEAARTYKTKLVWLLDNHWSLGLAMINQLFLYGPSTQTSSKSSISKVPRMEHHRRHSSSESTSHVLPWVGLWLVISAASFNISLTIDAARVCDALQ